MSQTVLVTGATGYIARHIVLKLLERGDHVVGSLRDPDRAEEVRKALTPHLSDPDRIDNLALVVADLDADDGWAAAMEGVDAVIHTASPFPVVQPEEEDSLIRPALDGTLRVLRAAKAAGVTRVLMTSSVAAVSSGTEPKEGEVYTEADWSDPTSGDISAYAKSKTLAERAAWEYVAGDGAGIGLTVLNPAFVMGAPLGESYGTSLYVIKRVLAANDPAMPKIGFTMVDVRDVAEAHLRALDRPETIGARIILADGFLWFREIAEAIQEAVPDRRIVTREAPSFFIRFLSWFDPSIKSIVPMLGKRDPMSNAQARALLGLSFRDGRESLAEAAQWLVAQER